MSARDWLELYETPWRYTPEPADPAPVAEAAP